MAIFHKPDLFTILITVLALACVAVVYVILTYLSVVVEVETHPREPMYECPKHGWFRKKHLITLFDGFEGDSGKICPICFHERQKKVEAGIFA